jgi:ribosomal protein L13E
LGGRGRWISEFEASLVYRVSSRTARAIQTNSVLKNQKTKQNKTKPQTKAGRGWQFISVMEAREAGCSYSQAGGLLQI